MTMKSIVGFTLLAVGALLAAVPAQAQESGQTSFTLVTNAEGGTYYFTLEGQTARNPDLVVPANTEITVTIKGTDDNVHNVCFVESTKCSQYVQAEGETQTLTFNSGANGGIYFCAPHKAAGMQGNVRIAGSTTTPTGGDQNKSPGVELVGVALAALGAALVLRRK